MAQSLYVLPDGQSPKPCHRFTYIYSDYANDEVFVNEDQRMIATLEIIRMVFDVGFSLTTIFEKYCAANVVEGTPLFIAAWRSQFMFDLRHLRSRWSAAGWTWSTLSVFTTTVLKFTIPRSNPMTQ
jgi:hypothetical protein